jgi:upstream activation factor subunit UAF30
VKKFRKRLARTLKPYQYKPGALKRNFPCVPFRRLEDGNSQKNHCSARKEGSCQAGCSGKACSKEGSSSCQSSSTESSSSKEAGSSTQAERRFHERDDPVGDAGRSGRRKPLPRTEVTKKVWDYIKAQNLQDAANRRMINADDKLKAVFGGKAQVSMFEMTKLISDHLK